ncbi:MAG: hypothetical protein J1E61_02575 [Lachnospiraceae bacterium]|nr:hypothetical protein [Lachnospiraceae bacterium]
MDEKKTIFDYLAQVMIIFGFAILVLNIFCLVFGNDAKDISAIFKLGDQGIPVGITLQFLCVSFLITGVRFVFFTDVIIQKMPIWLRTICMLTIIVIIIAAFIIIFNWFPVNMWQPWAMFFVCFGLSFLGTYTVVTVQEKIENKRMEEALQRLKEKEENKK